MRHDGSPLLICGWQWATCAPQVGLAFNYNSAVGNVTTTDLGQLQRLVKELDWIGLSCYSPLVEHMQPSILQGSLENFAREVEGMPPDL